LLQVITAQEKSIIQGETVNRLVEFDGMIGRRLATQLSSKNDASLVNSRLQQARSELVQTRALELRSRSQLEELTGQSVKEKLTRSSTSLGFENLDALQMASLDSSSEFASVRIARDLAENQIKQRTAELFPKLSGRVERVNSPSAGLVYTQAYVVFEASLGNGLSQLEGVNESSSRLLAAEQQIEATRRTLLHQTASSWADYVAYRDQTTILKDITQENQEIVASFMRQYLAGKKSWLEVLNAERELVQSRLQMADINSSLMAASYRLQRLSGQLTKSKEITLNE
jgi:adhesin transport system outer membrane protein